MYPLIDSHCHLDNLRFGQDLEATLDRARTQGVGAFILPAVDAASWPRVKALADPAKGLYAAYGLHPMFLAEHQPQHLDTLSLWLEQEQPVAVGECGLDFYDSRLDPTKQAEYLTAQLRLAHAFDLPVILHARRALDEVTHQIRKFPGLRGVVHSFSGSLQQAEQLFNLGFCIGLGGPLTYPRAQRLRRVAASLPLEALLLESDAPDQPGIHHRGQRNEPAFLGEILETLSTLRSSDPRTIAAATTANACRLFALPSPASTPNGSLYAPSTGK